MFWLVTGKPGASKTSHTLDFVMHDKRFKTESGEARPVYYRGIRELKLPWFELDDAKVQNWPAELPDGAVLVVDEAQQIWPVRAPSKSVPVGLTALETHRHHGWDIIFISQDPSLLDAHARKICNEHFHFSRPFGAPFVVRYHSGSGYVNPESKSSLASCVQTKMALPRRVFGLYKSAEVHTHKFRPPKMVFIIPVLVVLIIGGLWYFKHNFVKPPNETLISATASAGAGVASAPGGGQGAAVTSTFWQTAQKPRISFLPYTAPLYDSLASKPLAVPVVTGCMSMRADYSDCSCYTQQGTRIMEMSAQICAQTLRYGMFNPYKKDGFDEPVSGWRLAQATPESSKETRF